MANIKIRYFALLKDEAQISDEELNTDLKSYRELYDYLKERHDFSLPNGQIQVAVDDEYCQMDFPIKDNGQVVFIPPVSGG